MNNADLENRIAAAVKKALSDNTDFYNVPVKKTTKASTSTQGAWQIEKNPKASAATEGAWDATDTPGGVSSNAKKVWTVSEVEDQVRKVLESKLEFRNKVHPYPTGKTSASSTQVITQHVPSNRISASTQRAWDNADTPGAVSEEAKKLWNPDAIEKIVRKAVTDNIAAFHNPTHPYPEKTSASSTQVITEHKPTDKLSASTQPSWKKEEQPSGKINASVIAQILTNVYKL